MFLFVELLFELYLQYIHYFFNDNNGITIYHKYNLINTISNFSLFKVPEKFQRLVLLRFHQMGLRSDGVNLLNQMAIFQNTTLTLLVKRLKVISQERL